MNKMINRNKKRFKRKKNKFKYKKIFIFIFIVIILISLIIFGIWKTKDKFQFFKSNVTYKTNYYLLIGEDENKNADSVIVVSFIDNMDGFTAISFPPNTKINSKDDKDVKNVLLKETLLENGTDGVISAVENLLHIKIDKFAVFDYASFLETTKFSKDFDFYVEKNMEHKDAEGNFDIKLNQGYQNLNNLELLSYIRNIDDQNEVERIQHQERVIKAIIKKYKSKFSLINKLGAYYFWKPKESNISASEASNLILKAIDSKEENINFVIIPGEENSINSQKIWVTNQNELQKTIALTIKK